MNLLHPSKDLQLPVFTQCEDINTKYILKVKHLQFIVLSQIC